MITCPQCKHEFKSPVSLMGGKARWAGTTKAERSRQNAHVVKARWDKARALARAGKPIIIKLKKF